jgi:hypothetical protein
VHWSQPSHGRGILVLGTVFRRFDLELYETLRQRDIDIVQDCFIGEPSRDSPGVRVQASLVAGFYDLNNVKV